MKDTCPYLPAKKFPKKAEKFIRQEERDLDRMNQYEEEMQRIKEEEDETD